MICPYCNKTRIPSTQFRCSKCASKAIMNPKERNLPVGGATLWRKKNGNYTPNP